MHILVIEVELNITKDLQAKTRLERVTLL